MEAPGIGTLNSTEGVDVELVPDGGRKVFCVPRHHTENKNQSENDKMSKTYFLFNIFLFKFFVNIFF